jgi:hypothetical protein
MRVRTSSARTARTVEATTGLHALDFAVLWRNRPLWDVVVMVLLLGVGVSSVVPAFRRLARHARTLTAGDPRGVRESSLSRSRVRGLTP